MRYDGRLRVSFLLGSQVNALFFQIMELWADAEF